MSAEERKKQCGEKFTCVAVPGRIYECALPKGHDGECDDHPTRANLPAGEQPAQAEPPCPCMIASSGNIYQQHSPDCPNVSRAGVVEGISAERLARDILVDYGRPYLLEPRVKKVAEKIGQFAEAYAGELRKERDALEIHMNGVIRIHDRQLRRAESALAEARNKALDERCGNCDHHSDLHNDDGCAVQIQREDGKRFRWMVGCPCKWNRSQASDAALKEKASE